MLRKFSGALWVVVVLSVALLGCGGGATPAVPPPPALPTLPPAVATGSGMPAPSEPAAQLVPNTPDPNIKLPTFTPGPKVVSANRLVYVRGNRFWTANADGSDKQPLLGDDAPPIYSPPKDPGRAWASPGGDKVVYMAGPDGALWMVSVDGSDNHQVSDGLLPAPGSGTNRDLEDITRKLYSQEMAWSPDGSRLAFLGAPDGRYHLYIATLGGSEVVQVTDDEFREGDLAWSPDGRYLAYTGLDEKHANEYLYLTTVDGKRVTPVDIQSLLEQAQSEYQVLGGVEGVTWLDEETFFFYPLSPKGSLGIWKATVPSGAVSPIFTEPITAAEWSPEARAWVIALLAEPGKLWLLREGESSPELLVENGSAPLWSPDGELIVYSAPSEGSGTRWDIRAVRQDGTGDRLLAAGVSLVGREPPELGPEGKRYWSPDGKTLLYTAVGRSYGSPGPDLENWWAVSLEGGEPWAMSDLRTVFYLQKPEPSPDGKSYAFVGFWYVDKNVRMWTMSTMGGNVTQVDVPVRWFLWLP